MERMGNLQTEAERLAYRDGLFRALELARLMQGKMRAGFDAETACQIVIDAIESETLRAEPR